MPTCTYIRVVINSIICFQRIRLPTGSTLFPYTTLFRSLLQYLVERRRVVTQLGKLDYDATPFKDRKSGSAGMPRPISYAVFCLKKKNKIKNHDEGVDRVIRDKAEQMQQGVNGARRSAGT